MKCEFSGKTDIVGDYSIMFKKSNCPKCGRMVKITIPNKNMHSNVASLRAMRLRKRPNVS